MDAGPRPRVLLDACVPHRLIRGLTAFHVEAAQRIGLAEVTDGGLVTAIDRRYDVLVTRDRKLTFQQKIQGRSIAVVVMQSLDRSTAAFDALLSVLKVAIGAAAPGTVTLVGGS